MTRTQLVILLSACLLTVGPNKVRGQSARDSGLLIRDVTVISPERRAPLEHADVLIRNGRITALGQKLTKPISARTIDGKGKFLIPGLIDSHVHVGHSAALDDDAIDAHPELWTAYRAQVPRAYLAFGFTTVVDLDMTPSDRAWFEASPLHPRLYQCGRGIKVAGGYGAFNVPAPTSPRFPNLMYEPAEAASWPTSLDTARYDANHVVERVLNAGGTCVKAFVESGFGTFNWPYLHVETLKRIQAAAAAHNLPLMVHATSVDAWRIAVAAHANVIAHGLWIWPGNLADSRLPSAARGVIIAAARDSVYVQPTLQVVTGEHSMLDTNLLRDPRLTLSLPAGVIAYLRSPDGTKARLALVDQYRKVVSAFDSLLPRVIERSRATFRLMLESRVRLIFGSDTPSGDGYGNPPGLNGRLELQDWADEGAPLALILRAATLDNARALGFTRELGSIEVGKRADLLLLAKNPLVTVAAYDAIETIIFNGAPIDRRSLTPQPE
jgi:imidazolonepropionase-like amidohydrolase